jgi:hypothetical protein
MPSGHPVTVRWFTVYFAPFVQWYKTDRIKGANNI